MNVRFSILPVLSCGLLAIFGSASSCTKRPAGGPADQITSHPPQPQDQSRGESSQAPGSDVYTGALGRGNSGSTALDGSVTLSAASRQFVIAASENGILEILGGQLAIEKSQNTQIRQFAERMIQTHSQVNDSLARLASRGGLQIPVKPDEQGRQLFKKLQGLSGTEFDRTYAREMLAAHRRAVQIFEQASQSSPDAGIKALAQSRLPALRDYLRVAQTLPGTNAA